MQHDDALNSLIRNLRSTLAKLETALGTIDESILIVDGEGRIQWCNAPFEKLAKKPRIAMLGKPAPGILPLHDHDSPVPSGNHPTLAAETRSHRYSYLQGDETRYLEISGTRFQDRENATSAIVTIRDITATIDMDEARLTRAALEAAANAILITDAEGVIQWVNPSFTMLTGYAPEEAFGKTPALLRSGEHSTDFYRDMYATIFSGRVWKGELVNRRKDGSLYHEEQTVTPVADRKGRITHFIAIKQDISQRKETEQRILRTNALLDAITSAQSHFIAATSRKEFFDRLLTAVLTLTQSEYGFIGEVLHRDGKPYLKTFTLTNIAWTVEWQDFYRENAPQGLEFTNLETLFGAVLKTGKTLISNDPDSDPRAGGRPPGHPPLKSFLGIALTIGGQFVGMIGLANRPGGYDQELVDYLEPLSATSASLIVSFRIEQLRLQAEEETKEREKKYHSLFALSRDAILLHEPGGAIRDANAMAEELFGFSREELLAKDIMALLPPASRPDVARTLDENAAAGAATMLLPFLRKGGDVIQAEVSANVLELEGERLIQSLIRDVTERIASQRAIAASEARLSAILASAVDSIVVIDAKGLIVQVNRAVEPMFGYTMQELMGRNVSILMPEPHHSHHDAYIDNYIRSGEAKIIGVGRELPARRKDGSIFPIELAVSETILEDSRLFTAIVRDITERKAQETALGELNDKLQEKQQRIADDLRAAGEIQKSLLPKHPPATKALDVAWYFKPSTHVGGDIFGIADLGRERFAFSMVDVSGHGVPSALISVSISQKLDPEVLLRKGAAGGERRDPLGPAEVLETLDREFPLERFGKFFTILYMVLDARSGTLRYSSAGHPPPVLIRADGSTALLSKGGTIIGLGGLMPFEEEEIRLLPGDLIVLYTDGITEYENGAGEFFGPEKLVEQLQELRELPPLVICSRVWEALIDFSGGLPPGDDVSIMTIRFKGVADG